MIASEIDVKRKCNCVTHEYEDAKDRQNFSLQVSCIYVDVFVCILRYLISFFIYMYMYKLQSMYYVQ